MGLKAHSSKLSEFESNSGYHLLAHGCCRLSFPHFVFGAALIFGRVGMPEVRRKFSVSSKCKL